ncbi:putative transmembrane protein [Senna tora]|uniref:Putative transmembrane protein n=1 Tax=Senna tora TaxID=362788 RepID=A0A834TPQ3_9FABA|nr:putative transmembrane protein [Senna tora]
MQQRKPTIGRPSGTDGSDYSYRMVVDTRYQLVAKGKKRLALLFPLQAVLLLIGAVFAILPGTVEDAPNTLALSLAFGGLITLLIAELGRRRSKANLLGVYSFASSMTMLLAVNLGRRHSMVEVIRESSLWKTKKFDLNDFPALQAGLLVYIISLLLVQLLITKATFALISNMSPPRKAS